MENKIGKRKNPWQSQLKGNLRQLKIHSYLCVRRKIARPLAKRWFCVILLNLLAIDIWTWLALIKIDQRECVWIEIATEITKDLLKLVEYKRTRNVE